MTFDSAWQAFVALGIAGFGLGIGLVLAAFVARALRRYMSDEDMKPYDRDDRDKSDS